MKKQYWYGIGTFALVMIAFTLIHYAGEKHFWVAAPIIAFGSGVIVMFVEKNNEDKAAKAEQTVKNTVDKIIK